MVADSITDSQLLPGSPISRDFFKKQKANWVWKLKQLKIDARRRHLISQWKRANLCEEESGCSRLASLRDKPPDIKTLSERFSHLQAWSDDHHHELPSYGFLKCDYGSDDDETDLSASSSPTSVLKNKDSDSLKSWDDCFCCSNQIIEEEEEEAFDDADDTYEKWDEFSDALDIFDEEDPNPDTSQRKQEPSPVEAILPKSSRKKRNKKKKKSDQKKEVDEIMECPICFEEMDATDLLFSPCPCTFKLCLFCVMRINEHDGCCPSCRKKYEQTSRNSGEVSFQQRGRGTVRLSPSFKALDRA